MENLETIFDEPLNGEGFKKDLFQNLEDGQKYIYDQLKIMIDGIHLAMHEPSLKITDDELKILKYIEDQLIQGRFEVLKAMNQTQILNYLQNNPNQKNPYASQPSNQ